MSFRTWLKIKLRHKHSLWCGSLWNQQQPWIASGNCMIVAALTEHTHANHSLSVQVSGCVVPTGGPCSALRWEQSKPAQVTLRFILFFHAKIKKLKQQEKYIKEEPLLYQALAGHRPTVGMFYLTFGTVCWGFLLTASPYHLSRFTISLPSGTTLQRNTWITVIAKVAVGHFPFNNQVFVVLSRYD